jgi:FAD:protein FMN transferase
MSAEGQDANLRPPSLVPSPSSPAPDVLIHVTRRAMACEFEVRFAAALFPNGTQSALDALDRVEALEQDLSYFRLESRISRLNLLAAESPVEVDPVLFELLSLAARLHQETAGAYDITATPLWETWGFARRAGEMPSDAQLAEARTRVGGQLVELDPVHQTVRFQKPGVRISLGSIGKGYALDICAAQLEASGMSDFLLHAGQSSVLARGARPGSECNDTARQPWQIGIPDPMRIGKRLGSVTLRDQALGTSSGQFQSFRHQGRRYVHILDPRTGRPAEGVLSATVIAPTAALADALSTAFFVLGPERSLEYCQNHPKISMVIVVPGSRADDLVLHTAGPVDFARHD